MLHTWEVFVRVCMFRPCPSSVRSWAPPTPIPTLEIGPARLGLPKELSVLLWWHCQVSPLDVGKIIFHSLRCMQKIVSAQYPLLRVGEKEEKASRRSRKKNNEFPLETVSAEKTQPFKDLTLRTLCSALQDKREAGDQGVLFLYPLNRQIKFQNLGVNSKHSKFTQRGYYNDNKLSVIAVKIKSKYIDKTINVFSVILHS